MTLPELLAPAGDYETFVVAVNAGADAVYISGQNFGARAFAKKLHLGRDWKSCGICSSKRHQSSCNRQHTHQQL